MNGNNQFSVQLANGREQTFESAEKMVEWMERQRSPRLSANRNRNASRRGRRLAEKANPRKPVSSGEPPLARYANRNSGEV